MSWYYNKGDCERVGTSCRAFP